MTVRVGCQFSKRYCCISCVSQIGVLSSLFFLIYTTELLVFLMQSPYDEVQLYADDIKVYGIYNTKGITVPR